ncbi:hypothetical protein D3C77_583900 [compost metagenome]
MPQTSIIKKPIIENIEAYGTYSSTFMSCKYTERQIMYPIVKRLNSRPQNNFTWKNLNSYISKSKLGHIAIHQIYFKNISQVLLRDQSMLDEPMRGHLAWIECSDHDDAGLSALDLNLLHRCSSQEKRSQYLAACHGSSFIKAPTATKAPAIPFVACGL